MHRRRLVCSFGALLLAAFGVASAQNAYTSRPMHVRAGPNREYPLVAQLDAGAPLDVNGCLSDWSWCDVSFDGNRGWIYAGGLSFVYQGERVPLYSYAPSLGLPIITFSLASYWDTYYRGRPWYSQRDMWAHRPLPPRTRPPGRPHAGPPPMPNARPPVVSGRPGRPSPGGRPEARGEEGGHAAPAERRSPQPSRTRAPQEKRPPSSRDRSDHQG
jgi:uncharacterized protein YraI